MRGADLAQRTPYRQYSEGHEHREKLLATLERDEMVVPVAFPAIPDAAAKIAGLEVLLTAPHLAAAEAEYQATRKRLNHRPRFHALWGGPRNVQELAAELGHAGHYEILYRQWSLTGHADDVVRQLTHVDGVPALRPFRSGEGLSSAYGFAVQFGVTAMRLLLGFYRAEELGNSFPAWYKSHVMNPLRRLTATT